MNAADEATRRAIRIAGPAAPSGGMLARMSQVAPSSSADRAEDRRAPVIYRTSRERRERLKARAAEQGVSVQVYLDALLWDEPLAPDRVSGPKRQMELPLTG